MADKTEHQEKENDARKGAAGKAGSGRDGKPDPDTDAGAPKEREGFSDPLEFLNAELEKAETEKTELQERVLRMAAEMENLRKRTQKDVADARIYAITSFAREMLGVADNLGRALDAVSDEAREKGEESLKSLIEGVELTGKSMQQALEKSGVKRISPLEEKFDPHFHQAMFEIPNSEVPNNTVLQVVQDGYVIGDRVLRPAMVGVSRGGPKQPAAVSDGQESTSDDGDAEAHKDAEKN